MGGEKSGESIFGEAGKGGDIGGEFRGRVDEQFGGVEGTFKRKFC
jgi:hypothetical protein